jgi:carbon-monoxide dehydrogenase medium subunit
VAAVAVRLTLEGGKISDAMVVLGAVAPVPLVAPETMKCLVGEEPGDEVFDRAAVKAAEESRPISDVRGSKEWRRKLIEVLTRRALDEALERAKGVKG